MPSRYAYSAVRSPPHGGADRNACASCALFQAIGRPLTGRGSKRVALHAAGQPQQSPPHGGADRNGTIARIHTLGSGSPPHGGADRNVVVEFQAILQIKVWLVGVSPMVWRRVLVPAGFTLRELHGVIQVTMGWEGIHLYDFQLRAARYGSSEVAASSPDVTLAALGFRKGTRFVYE